MSTFLHEIWLKHPITLSPCDDEAGDIHLIPAPENIIVARLLASHSEELHHCGVISHDAGYDCDVWLIPVDVLERYLSSPLNNNGGPGQNAIEKIQKQVQRWKKKRQTLIRAVVPRKYLTFETEQQVWGHESEQHSPTLRRHAGKLRQDCCDSCGYTHKANQLIFRDGNPENQTDDNLGIACPVCAFSSRLNKLGANDGVMVYLPAISPADISHLLRTIVIARREGSERQKADAEKILCWLTEHRREAEDFWGTSHPGEFGLALMQAPSTVREDLQQRLRHVVLILNPDLLLNHSALTCPPPATWDALAEKYHRHA